MGKLLGFIIKIFIIALLLYIGYCATIGREYGKKQFNKIVGMYYVYLGDKAYKEHNMQDAVNAYQSGLILFPSHYEAWLNLGNIYVAYEDYYSAAQAYQNAILAKENYTPARMNLGIITAEKLGDFDSAIAQYQSIISSKHFLVTIPFVFDNKKSETANKAIAYYNMGRAYSQKAFYLPPNETTLKREYLGNAVSAYEKAVNIVKNSYDINYNLALTYHLLGDYRKAGQYYCSAIESEPMHYESHYNLGLMLRHLKQEGYALDELEKAAVLSTGKYSAHANYIFDVLSTVTMESIAKGKVNKLENLDEQANKKDKKNKKKKNKEEHNEDEIILVNGKITPTDATDMAIMENFRKCNSKNIFKGL